MVINYDSKKRGKKSGISELSKGSAVMKTDSSSDGGVGGGGDYDVTSRLGLTSYVSE